MYGETPQKTHSNALFLNSLVIGLVGNGAGLVNAGVDSVDSTKCNRFELTVPRRRRRFRGFPSQLRYRWVGTEPLSQSRSSLGTLTVCAPAHDDGVFTDVGQWIKPRGRLPWLVDCRWRLKARVGRSRLFSRYRNLDRYFETAARSIITPLRESD